MAGDRAKDDEALIQLLSELGGTSGRRSPRFVKQSVAVLGLVGGLVTGGGGSFAAAKFMLTATIQHEIQLHDADQKAHVPLILALERIQSANQNDDVEKARIQKQLDEIQRDLRRTSETLARLEERLGRGGR